MMENPNPRPGGRESVIDQECYFEGTFRTPGNMRIEGSYQGVIECQGTLTIAESGQVNARIVAGNFVVAGRFQGDVQCDGRFEVLNTGHVTGMVTAGATVIHDGAFIAGEVRMAADRDTGAMGAREAVAPRRQSALEASSAPPVRRRAAELTPPGEEPGATNTAEAGTPPQVNGRNQPVAGRDALPNP